MISDTVSTNTAITPFDSFSCARSGQVTLRTCSLTSRKKSSAVVRVVSAMPLRARGSVPGDGLRETGSRRPRVSPRPERLLGLLVRLVLVAPRAVLAVLEPLGVLPLVLRLVVVPLLALGAGEDDL